MKRFFFEEEDDDNDEDMTEDGEGRMMPEFIPEILAMSGQTNPAAHILDCSIRICEKSFFWRFMSISKKIKMVESVFGDLSQLLEFKDSDIKL
jgi:hypothetical protein